MPEVDAAVTDSTSAWPTSLTVGVYVSSVAPGIEAHVNPAASQLCHWYVNVTGLPPLQNPGTAASFEPACAVPTTLGGVETAGTPPGKAGRANCAGSVPLSRSPSTQWAMPGIDEQSVHCQNAQPRPPQLDAGTVGAAFFVQCAIQSRWLPAATVGESPSPVFQKLGET